MCIESCFSVLYRITPKNKVEDLTFTRTLCLNVSERLSRVQRGSHFFGYCFRSYIFNKREPFVLRMLRVFEGYVFLMLNYVSLLREQVAGTRIISLCMPIVRNFYDCHQSL